MPVIGQHQAGDATRQFYRRDQEPGRPEVRPALFGGHPEPPRAVECVNAAAGSRGRACCPGSLRLSRAEPEAVEQVVGSHQADRGRAVGQGKDTEMPAGPPFRISGQL